MPIATGFKSLDSHCGGLLQPGITLVASENPEDGGKFAISMLHRLTQREQARRVFLISPRRTKEELMTDLVSIRSGVPLVQVSSCLSAPGSINRVKAAVEKLVETELYFEDNPSPAIDDLAANIRSHLVLSDDGAPGVIVLDSLRELHATKGEKISRENMIQEVGRLFSSLARDLGAAVLILTRGVASPSDGPEEFRSSIAPDVGIVDFASHAFRLKCESPSRDSFRRAVLRSIAPVASQPFAMGLVAHPDTPQFFEESEFRG